MTSILRVVQLMIFCWSAYTAIQVGNARCLICSSSTDENCAKDLTAIGNATFCEAWCFTRVHDNGTVERGCMEEKATEEASVKDKCQEPNCRYCDASNKTCNKHTICKSCDSKTDAACSQTDVSKESYNSLCATPETQCVSKVRDSDKHIERRCFIESDTDSDLTKLCTGNNCNEGIFPPQRIQCYQCEASSKCANLADNSDISSKPCLLYDAKDSCYTHGSNDTSMTRGCVSDLAGQTEGVCSGATLPAECKACTTDNCNNRPYMRNQAVLCFQCQVNQSIDTTTVAPSTTTVSPSTTTTAPTLKLASAANTAAATEECSEAKNCRNKLLYSQDDACYSQIANDNSVIYQGCLYDRDVAALGECNDTTKCQTCNENGCNHNATETSEFTCIRCRSDVDPNCLYKPSEFTGTSCSNEVVDASDEECYYGTWNNVLIRGCMVDADPRMQRTCKDTNNPQCEVCKGKDCNKVNTIDGASTLLMTVPTALFFTLCAKAINHWQAM